MPRKGAGRPPAQEKRPATTDSPSATADAQPAERTPTSIVQAGSDVLPVVHASVFPPGARRSQWWLTYLCPACLTGNFGRVHAEEDVAGKRRTRCCGLRVRVKAARTYRGRAVREAA